MKKAFEAMVDVADYVNEVKRDKETLQIIQDLQVKKIFLYLQQILSIVYIRVYCTLILIILIKQIGIFIR